MDRVGSRIHSMAELKELFKTSPSPWAPSFPKLVYSFGISATDNSLPQGIGLYSTSASYNFQFNSLVFFFKSFEEIPTIPSTDSFVIELQLGSTLAICPLGSVYHDLNVAPGKDRINVFYINGRIRFENAMIFNGKVYRISVKVGYKDASTLSMDPDTGFGYISLIYNEYTIFKSQVVMRKGFNKIFDNKNLITNDWVEEMDVTNLRRHRGVSSYRTGYNMGDVGSNYNVVTNQHGLRPGDGQDFFLQTTVGPNFLYYTTTLDSTHDSSKTFIQLITSTAITSKTSSWNDRFKRNN